MKISNILTILFTFFFFGIFLIFPKAAKQPFDIYIYTDIQNPQTKEFEIVLKIDSDFSTDRARITWYLPDNISTLDLDTKFVQSEDIVAGENVYRLKVLPNKSGDTTVRVTLQTFESSKSYLITQIANMAVNDSLEIEPQTVQYKQLNNLVAIQGVINILIVIVLVLLFILLLVRKIYLIKNPEIVTSKIPRDSRILDEMKRQASLQIN